MLASPTQSCPAPAPASASTIKERICYVVVLRYVTRLSRKLRFQQLREVQWCRHFFFDWTHSAVTLHVCGLHRAPYRFTPVPCQRLFRRRHSPTVSREHTQRPGKRLGICFSDCSRSQNHKKKLRLHGSTRGERLRSMMDKPAPVPKLPPVCPPNGTLLLREAGVCREGPYIVGLSRKGPWPRVL